MKKNNFKFFAAAGVLAVTALASCSVNDDINEREKNNPVRFTAGIAALPKVDSRAAGSDWEANDAVGIFMVQGSTALAENKQYEVTNAATGAFGAVSGDEIYYPQSGSVDFIAYYPYATGATLGTPIQVVIGAQNNQPTFDLLYSVNATDVTKADNPVTLTFEHQLSKLVMNVIAGDGLSAGDLTGMTVTIKGMSTETTFNLSTGSLDTPGTPAEITPRELTALSGYAASYDAIILPSAATTTDGQYSVEFIIDPQGEAEPFVWNMAAGTDFAAGNEYTYAVTLSRTGVTATGEITPWNTTDNDRGGVTAE
ncbi:MAG: fimbrillin family protein [Rikenellaceae bacterium]|nr:fimbrillin family protein [Rikenellaceae bacterium]